MRPVLKYDGEPDRFRRTLALFARVPPQPTLRERWALRWRIWMGEGLAIVMVPFVIVAIASALLVLWLMDE